MAPEVSYPLARAVKRVLDVVRILAISALVIWPLVVVALTLGKPAGSDSWGVDVSVHAALRLDLGELGAELDDSSGVRNPVIKGRTPLTVDTSSTKAHLVSALVVEIGGLVGLYILLQLRAVFGHLTNGDTFNPDSARRIKIMGVAVTHGYGLECSSSVDRPPERGVQHVHRVFVHWVGEDLDVVPGA